MSQSALKFGFTAKQIIEEGLVTEDEINLVKGWLVDEKLPNFTDEQIVHFLLSCDKQQELTKTTIRAFYRVRNSSPELFDNRKIERENINSQLKTLQFCVLPKLTDDGCAIVFFRFFDVNYSNFEFAGMLTLIFMTLDAAIYNHPPKGFIILFDMKGMGLGHLMKLRPGLVMKFFQYVQEALPVKLKCMHMINSVSFMSKIMALIRPFAKKEVLDAMYFHPSTLEMEEFYEIGIPKSCLPEDLGGYLPSIDVLHEKNIKQLADMESHFEAEENIRHSLGK